MIRGLERRHEQRRHGLADHDHAGRQRRDQQLVERALLALAGDRERRHDQGADRGDDGNEARDDVPDVIQIRVEPVPHNELGVRRAVLRPACGPLCRPAGFVRRSPGRSGRCWNVVRRESPATWAGASGPYGPREIRGEPQHHQRSLRSRWPRRNSASLCTKRISVKACARESRWISSTGFGPASSLNTARVLFFTSRVAAKGKMASLQQHRHDEQHAALADRAAAPAVL